MSFQLDQVLKNLNNQPVNIDEDVFAYLSPFSAHQVEVEGEIFATVEHAYQASRFKNGSKERGEIKNAKSPLQAWFLAQEYKANKEVFVDYSRQELVVTFERLFRLKYEQHEEIRHILEMTKDRGIIKIFGKDNFWGTGEDGSGQNKMGKLWMKIRDEK
jgi:ribA/ribD-fused uncharacterized protein